MTVFSVFDMLMMILLYFNLKVADVSLSESGHLAPSWLTGHKSDQIPLRTGAKPSSKGIICMADEAEMWLILLIPNS